MIHTKKLQTRLVALIALLLVPLWSLAETIDLADTNGNVLRYSYSGTGAASVSSLVSVSEDADLAGHIIIPATITDADEVVHNVTSIASNAFSNKKEVLSVSIGANVTTINDYAFSGCSNLAEATGGVAVKTLGANCFRSSGLTKAFIPDAVETIGSAAFIGCPLKEIVFGSSVQSISTGLFRNYTSDIMNVERIVFNGTYTSIPSSFCTNCPKLTEIVLGDNITSIGGNSFQGTPLTSLTLPSGLTSIGSSAFENCDRLKSVVIPDNVTSLSNYTFSGCDSLQQLVIGSAVTSLGDYAFSACIKLTNVTGGESLKTIGSNAFRSSGLTKAFIPDAVQTIGSGAFIGCPLKEIVFGSSVQSISSGQFRNYTSDIMNVERIVFNGTYTSIPSSFCTNCQKLTEIVLGDNITSIGGNSFQGTPLTSLTLPSGLTSIGSSAFENCDRLKSVVIPDNVTSLSNYAFSGCDSLQQLVIGSAVTSLGDYAFSGCIKLTNVTGGTALTSIGSNAFRNTKLTKAFIPDAVQTIGSGAFIGCPLKEIVFGPNVQSITSGQFRNYTSDIMNVERIVFNGTYTSIPSSFCNNYPKLTEIALGENITSLGQSTFQSTPIISVTLPSGLTSIGSYAFDNCDRLKSIVIPDNVTSVGSYAFQNCDSLKQVTLGEKVTSLNDYAFYNCISLTTIIGGDAVTKIGNYAFYNTKLTKAFLPDAVQTIGSAAFRYCPLKEVEFGPNVQSINYNIFKNYSNDVIGVERLVINGTFTEIPNNMFSYWKIKELVIGNNVQTIGSSAFNNCDSLLSVTIPSSVTSIGSSAFAYCDKLQSVNLGSGLQSINSYAFDHCQQLVSVSGGSALKSIGDYAFQYCTKLQAFNGHNSLETIGYYAFYDCYNMTELTGLEAVKSVGTYALYYCSALTELTFGTALTTFNYQSNYTEQYGPSALRYLTLPCAAIPFTSNGSNGLPSGLLIYVPEELLESYRAESKYARFRFMAIGASENFAITTTEGGQLQEKIEEDASADQVMELKIIGPINGTDIDYIHRYLTNIEVLDLEEAEIVNGGDSYHRWQHAGNTSTQYQSSSYNTQNNVVGSFMFANLTGLRKLVLPAGVTSIGNYAFSDCGRLTEITIPDGVTSIGSYAFSYAFSSSNCPRPTTLHLPSQLTSLGSYAFYYMKSPQSIEIPAGVETINEYTFGYCGVRNVTLNEGLKTISTHAFYSSSVQNVNLPSTLETMGEYAFGSSSVRSITLPASLNTIPQRAFSSCTNLNAVTFSEGQETIGSYAFNGCTNLQTITFSEGLQTIQPYAFFGCQNVKSVHLPQSLKAIDNNAFDQCYRLEEATLPDALETLGNYAFCNCDSLTTFTFPENITIVPEYVLAYSDKLQTINLASNVRRISGYAFDGCFNLKSFDFDRYTKLNQIYGYSFQGTGLTEVDLPDRIDTLFVSAFRNCKSLKRAKMPAGVDYVASDLFHGCDSLEEVVMHDGINRINSDAFNGCKSLSTIDLNDGITIIGNSAFYGCSILELPNRLLPPNMTTINSNAFYGCSKLQLEAYPSGLTEILNSAFRECTSLTNGNLPTGLKKLDSHAFRSSGLTSVVIPEGITTFGTSVFESCKSLVNVTWPADQKVIPNYTFYGCYNMSDPNLPDEVTEISLQAFYNCNFKTFHFPTSLVTIGQQAFEYCYGLTEIELPISLRTIRQSAFHCTKLRHVEIPDSVTTVEGYVFDNCDSLRSAYLGRIMNYGTSTYFTYFNDCDSLKLVRIYAGTPPTMSSTSYISRYYKNCILEVPAGVDSLYREANIWKDFKEIRTFLTGDKLDAIDYAILKRLYQLWDGDNWTHKWDLETDDRFIGKWYGVTFDGDHISTINLTNNNLNGPLTHDVFDLPALTSLDLGNNYLTAQLDTILAQDFADSKMTRIQLYGNRLEGDLYPFASKFSALTYLSVSYNNLTAISQPISKTTLQSAGNQLWFSDQFCDYKTQKPFVSEKYPARRVHFGEPIEIEWNSLQTYDHSKQDYSRSHTNLFRMYCNSNGSWTYDSQTYYARSNDHYIVGTGSVLYPSRDEPMLLTPSTSSAYMTPIVVEFYWDDGDINADLTVDVTDLQNLVYYAVNNSKPSGKAFNYTAANAINDKYIDVRDIVVCVNSILDYNEPDTPAGVRPFLNNNYAESRNGIALDNDRLCMANADEVAALQLTILNQPAEDLALASDISGFRLAKRQMGENTRVIIYSPDGRTIQAGEHNLLTGISPDALVTDARLSDREADYLEVAILEQVTAIDTIDITAGDIEAYDISGRRVLSLGTAPTGVYVIKKGNKQFKIKK